MMPFLFDRVVAVAAVVSNRRSTTAIVTESRGRCQAAVAAMMRGPTGVEIAGDDTCEFGRVIEHGEMASAGYQLEDSHGTRIA